MKASRRDYRDIRLSIVWSNVIEELDIISGNSYLLDVKL